MKKQKSLDAFLEKADMPQQESTPTSAPQDFWTMAGEPQPLPAKWKYPKIFAYNWNIWCVHVIDMKTRGYVLVGKFRDGPGGISGRQQARALVADLLKLALAAAS